MKNINLSLIEFSNDVGSKKTMPGGGSVCAYALSLSNALASMVSNFTVGKKKYIEYDEDIKRILSHTEKLSTEILNMVDEDCEAFMPLSAAYKMPEETEEEKKLKDETMQRCLKRAAEVPFKLILACEDILSLHEELLTKGSKMLISDVGVGVMMLKSACKGAKINVLININSIKDIEYVETMWEKTVEITEKVDKKCEEIYSKVVEELMFN